MLRERSAAINANANWEAEKANVKTVIANMSAECERIEERVVAARAAAAAAAATAVSQSSGASTVLFTAGPLDNTMARWGSKCSCCFSWWGRAGCSSSGGGAAGWCVGAGLYGARTLG